jgi:hypothetical protein
MNKMAAYSNLDVYALGKDKAKWDMRLEAYTQLIVQECVDIIESQDVDPSFKLRMSWAIKKHFGVEE